MEEFEANTNDAFKNIYYSPEFSDPQNQNFNLLKESKIIDKGAFLTIITSPTGGSYKSFSVEDAGFFYDGWSIPTETGDVIRTENGRVAKISKVNYETNTISVENAIDIVNGEGITL